MQLSIQQTSTNFHMQWEVLDKDNNRYALVDAPYAPGKFEADIILRNHTPKKLYYNIHDKSWGTKIADRMSFKIFENNDSLIGTITGENKKTGLLKGYVHYPIMFDGVEYYGYEVGFGAKGLFLCIYKGDKLIAVVNKKLRVINFKDSYVCYIEDESFADVVLSFIVYYDIKEFGDYREIALQSASERHVVTLQKELIAKYDPGFIPGIIEKDGYVI